jgi:hypothetical protein
MKALCPFKTLGIINSATQYNTEDLNATQYNTEDLNPLILHYS